MTRRGASSTLSEQRQISYEFSGFPAKASAGFRNGMQLEARALWSITVECSRTLVRVSLVFGAVAILWIGVASSSERRRLTVEDSIGVASFGTDPDTTRLYEVSGSPDARNFALVTTRGRIQTNENESTLWLFETSRVNLWLEHASEVGAPRPRRLVALAASAASDGFAIGSRDAITDLHWTADSSTIMFLGRNKAGGHSLFNFRVSNGTLRQVTPDNLDVIKFAEARGIVVISATEMVKEEQLYDAGGVDLPRVEAGTGRSVISLMFPIWAQLRDGANVQTLWRVKDRRLRPIMHDETGKQVSLVATFPMARVFVLSPSGRFLVAARSVEHIPKSWESYEPASPELRFTAGDVDAVHNPLAPAELVLFDLVRGTITSLVKAPMGWSGGYMMDQTKVVWSSDELQVAVSNVYLPIGSGGESALDGKRPCVLVVDVPSLRSSCLSSSSSEDAASWADSNSRYVSGLVWASAARKLVVEYSPAGQGQAVLPKKRETFGESHGIWHRVVDGTFHSDDLLKGTVGDLNLAIQQSLNQPPVLAARKNNGQFLELWNPNPHLANFDLGEASVYKWTDGESREWTGGLVKPSGYITGKRYPLVIQTHGFDPQRFLLDGFDSTANAARVLAGRGIAVLQVGEISAAPWGTPSEAKVDGRDGYVAAIERLGEEGIVDQERVGIVGFSRTGWYVLDTLIHRPEVFVTAVLADPVTETLCQYLSRADDGGSSQANLWAAPMGGTPFGDGLKQWIARSPGFQTDKIATPILFEMNNPYALITVWDLYASLRLQAKPVDLLYLRNANHVVNRPLELMASQETTVDWFDFWLNDREDPAPTKSAQYGRWRALKSERVRSAARVP
nr:hypothetical protein Hi04_10k_c4921_00006 [uncultured bacterium]